MPTTFSDREQAFEAKFAHDEEFRFLIAARRDKLLAAWVAAQLKLSDEQRDALLHAVIAIPDGPGHEAALLQHVASLAGNTLARESVAAAWGDCAQEARQQLMREPAFQSDIL